MDRREQSGGGAEGLQLKLGFSVWAVFGFVSSFFFIFRFWRELNTDDLRVNRALFLIFMF